MEVVTLRFKLKADKLWPQFNLKDDLALSIVREELEALAEAAVRIGRFSVAGVRDLSIVDDGTALEGTIVFNDKIEIGGST